MSPAGGDVHMVVIVRNCVSQPKLYTCISYIWGHANVGIQFNVSNIIILKREALEFCQGKGS